MKTINSALILALAITAASAIPSFAQYPYYRQPPVWQPSTNGEFYDATGQIQGTVPGSQLPMYGGRMDNGASIYNPYAGSINAQQAQLWYLEQMRRNHRRAGNFVPLW